MGRPAVVSAEEHKQCASCGSGNLGTFNGEIAIHFPGLKNINRPIVWVFPKTVICIDCGLAQFAVPEAELGVLADQDPASGSA